MSWDTAVTGNTCGDFLTLVTTPLSITSTAFNPSTATVGVGYSANSAMAATGGTTPYTWSATGFPNGMSINSSTGAPFGTPTVAGTFNVTVTVRDSSSSQQTASKTLTLTVNNATSALSVTSTAFNPSTATVGAGYSANAAMSATGGQTPYTWTASGFPNGMSINSSTGAPFGTPTIAGTFNVTVTVRDSSSSQQTASKTLTLTVNNATTALSITSTAFDPSTATVGVGYSANAAMSATGGQTPYTWSASGFPNGMSINSSTGAPFGTPTVAGTFNVTVTVRDSSGSQQTASKTLTLTVSNATSALSITSTAFDPSTATVGVGYSANAAMSATGGQGPYTWSATGFPSGMSINSSTGAPFGTPTVAGTFSVTVTVRDSSSSQQTASKTLSLTVNNATSALSITSTAFNPSTATVGVGYSANAAMSATGGQTPYTWSATGFPSGMSINSSTGAPFGTPTAAGTFNVTVTVRDSSSSQQTASKTLTLTVNNATSALSITTTAFDPSTATVGVGYSANAAMSATGGQTPYTWSATGFPGGMSINSSTGAPFGIPTAAGTFNVTITVRDSSSSQQTASKTLTLTVNNAMTALSITSTAFDPSTATVGVGYSANAAMSATGGQTPYTWSATGFPNGMSINSSTGAPFGTPTVAGTFNVTVTVRDSSSTQQTASKTLTLTVNNTTSALSIASTGFDPATATVGVGYSANAAMSATGGQTPYTWSATGFPNGMSINSSTGAPFGTPTVAGTFSVTVTVRDSSSSQQTASKTLTLTVNNTTSALSITSTAFNPSTATVGVGYAAQSAVSATGGQTPYTWSATGFPSGMSINSSTGAPFGTPTVAGTFNVTVTVRDSTSPQQIASKTLTLTVNNATSALSITSAAFDPPTATVGVGYAANAAIAATGGQPPYSWAATGFPSGMSINSSNGAPFGTPTLAGTFTVTITVRDSSSPQQTASKTLPLIVGTVPSTITVTTNAASRLTSTTAQLNGMVDPHGLTATVNFEYGPTTAYGSTTVPDVIGTTSFNVFHNIASLSPASLYHCRLVARTPNGPTYGNDVSFITQAATGGTTLSITGNAIVVSGMSASYRVFLQSATGQSTEVTEAASFSFGEPVPTFASFTGSTLFVNRNVGSQAIYIVATYHDGSGVLTSTPFAINVQASIFSSFTANVQSVNGSNVTVALDASVTGGAPPYTFRWDTDRNGAYGDVIGQHATYPLVSDGGTYPIGLQVTDGFGAVAYAKGNVVVNKPVVPNQPHWVKPIGDVNMGAIYNSQGHLFNFDTTRTSAGFIVITHGLYESGLDVWPRDMAQRIEKRLQMDANGRVPNVAVYDWGEYSDPGGEVNPYAIALLKIISTVKDGFGIWNAAKLGLDAISRELFKQALLSRLPDPLELAARGGDFLVDVHFVRNRYAQTEGQALADWIQRQARAGLIDTRQPIQLIGNSAGGFVVGECARLLKNSTAGPIIVDRVTMLDTPYPIANHITTLPNPTIVEQVVSSAYGALEVPETQKVSPGLFYHYKLLPGFELRWDIGDAGHGLARRWYARSILPENEIDGAVLDGYGTDGFSLSPFLHRGAFGTVAESHSATARGVTSSTKITQAIADFASFGNVGLASGVYTLTEEADAGITTSVTIPANAKALQFRFQFTSDGDGDFLAVRLGDDHILYAGLDDQISRDGPISVEAELEGLVGATDNLTFTLVSRGQKNSVMQLSDIGFVIGDSAPAVASSALANIATRLDVGIGDRVSIAGVIVTGTQQKKVMIRGIGPSLSDFGILGTLADPTLELHDSGGALIALNDNWKDSQQTDIEATTIPPRKDLESAMIMTLAPGAYTSVLRDKNSMQGIGVVEVYDLDPTTDSRLANISTRGFVDTGDNVIIGGTIIVGSSPANVLVRAIGPSLTQFGVPNALQDPILELHDGNGALIESNDDWRSDHEADIIATTIPPTDNRESAILRILGPGAYTAVVRGNGNSTGVALVEAYQLQ